MGVQDPKQSDFVFGILSQKANPCINTAPIPSYKSFEAEVTQADDFVRLRIAVSKIHQDELTIIRQ